MSEVVPPLPDHPSETGDADAAPLSRRRFLRGAAVAGGGLLTVGLAGCATSAAPDWRYNTAVPAAAPSASPAASAGSSMGMDMGSPAPGGSPAVDWRAMDAAMDAVVKRYPEKTDKVGNQPLTPRVDGDWKVFDLEALNMQWQIDAQKKPVAALGYNGMWPGPLLRVTEGDKVRAILKNSMTESTVIHFHGQHLPNKMDGVPSLTQDPVAPGGTFVYEFLASPSGSHMYHSHHNSADQVGRGLLGAFIVDPKDPAQRYQVDQDVVWISNDALGGFTINGKGFPATNPIVAKKGQRVLVRFMNEGTMSHPWHLHGMHFQVVARDGWPLGSAAFRCDTLGVNPGERYDVIIECDNVGAWAFHCHILTHAESSAGMFGMVNALIVQE